MAFRYRRYAHWQELLASEGTLNYLNMLQNNNQTDTSMIHSTDDKLVTQTKRQV